MKKTNYDKPNMTAEERLALGSLKNRKDIAIKSAGKGGRVIVMDRNEYLEKCKALGKKLSSDPTLG